MYKLICNYVSCQFVLIVIADDGFHTRSQARGYDTSRHILACFGGAGGQHACAIARALGISTVYIHK